MLTTELNDVTAIMNGSDVAVVMPSSLGIGGVPKPSEVEISLLVS